MPCGASAGTVRSVGCGAAAYSDESDRSVRGFRTRRVGGRVAADAGVLPPPGHLLLGIWFVVCPSHAGSVLLCCKQFLNCDRLVAAGGDRPRG